MSIKLQDTWEKRMESVRTKFIVVVTVGQWGKEGEGMGRNTGGDTGGVHVCWLRGKASAP